MEIRGQLHDLAALPLGKEPCYPLIKRQSAPQSQPKRFGEKKYFLPLTGTEIQFTGCTDCSQVTTLCYHDTYVFYNTLSNLFTYYKLTCKDAIIRFVDYYLYCAMCDRWGLAQLKALCCFASLTVTATES
jgi:hypothetical protein